MLKGIYSAAAGMESIMTMNDVMADNLANTSTPGFKKSGVQFQSFGETLIKSMGSGNTLGTIAQGSQVTGSVVNFTQGDMVQTGNPLDIALKGNGFFTLKMPDNSIAYTRAGNFTRDAKGYLTTESGARVQGNQGDIVIPASTQKIEIKSNGDVQLDGNSVGKLQISQFQNPQTLQKMGANTFTTTDAPLAASTNVTVTQGSLEHSNSNAVKEMVSSITGLRTYETLQKSIQMQDETLQKAINQVGLVQ
jgi:flagellar basal-body rod protein FlgF